MEFVIQSMDQDNNEVVFRQSDDVTETLVGGREGVTVHGEELNDSADDSTDDLGDYSEEDVFKDDDVLVDDTGAYVRKLSRNGTKGADSDQENAETKEYEFRIDRKRSDISFNSVLDDIEESDIEQGHEREEEKGLDIGCNGVNDLQFKSTENGNSDQVEERKVSTLDIAPLKCVCHSVSIPCVRCTANLIQQRETLTGSWPQRSNNLSVHWSYGEPVRSKYGSGRPERLGMSEGAKCQAASQRHVGGEIKDSGSKSYSHLYRSPVSESTILEEDLPVIVRRRGCTLRVKITSITDEDLAEFERQCVCAFYFAFHYMTLLAK